MMRCVFSQVLNEIPLTLSVGWCLLSVIQGSAGKQLNSEEGKTCIMQITNYLGPKNRSGVLIFEEHARPLSRPGEGWESSGLAEA